MRRGDRPRRRARGRARRARARAGRRIGARRRPDEAQIGREPDWRAPRSWPSPRISRSRSASSNPSVVATMESRRSLAVSVSSSFARETSRQYDCSAPRPTRPRSWWSWARPKRSASWTIMIVAFGTSTPTSITVVATRTSSSRALKLAITLRRSAGGRRPWRQPTRYPRSSAERSRSASSSAARATRVSDASMSGQTTYAWRPSSRWRRSRAYASALRSSLTQAVTIGLRFAGGAAISDTARSP